MKYPLRSLIAIACTGAALVALPAHSVEVKDQIKHREAIMEAIGGHMSAIFSTLAGPPEMQKNFAFHADSLLHLSNIAVDVFPEGSGEGKTEALKDIWEKPDEFKQAMDLFLERVATLEETIDGGGDVISIAAAAKKLGGACKGCHDDFKKD